MHRYYIKTRQISKSHTLDLCRLPRYNITLIQWSKYYDLGSRKKCTDTRLIIGRNTDSYINIPIIINKHYVYLYIQKLVYENFISQNLTKYGSAFLMACVNYFSFIIGFGNMTFMSLTLAQG